MKIAVIGANGQLGHEIVRIASERGYQVEKLTRNELDVSNLDAIDEVVSTLDAQTLFNCSAYNLVDNAEEESDIANLVNGLAPARMANAARRAGIRIAHFSTDYVFGHGHIEPIDESHKAHPLSAYGRSKRMGELGVLHAHPDALVIRTTGLYSSRRKNFVTSMLNFARSGRELTVVDDQTISPTWVRPLAAAALDLANTRYAGIVHAVSHGGCSWFELAHKAFELGGVEAKLSPISQEEWGAAAPRPPYSVLDNSVLRALGLDHHFEPWDVALAEFFRTQSP